MQVTIRTDDSRPIYQQIMDEVRRALVTGTLRADEPLPSVRELAAELRVNPNTVAQAYRELEREDVVYVRRGRGTFVSPDYGIEEEERHELALDVARRALVDAHRNGIDLNELLTALNEVARESPVEAAPVEEGEGT
ncbi:MAG: GntR family transcriptional regulator [Gemmatimonadota bacterium]|nr:GntR family transcriptional regulator [Gemmatimonadota bacterium]